MDVPANTNTKPSLAESTLIKYIQYVRAISSGSDYISSLEALGDHVKIKEEEWQLLKECRSKTNLRLAIIDGSLMEGSKFRFVTDSPDRVRTCQQIGKNEIYAPLDDENTMGHSMAGGEEVYMKYSEQPIILLDADVE